MSAMKISQLGKTLLLILVFNLLMFSGCTSNKMVLPSGSEVEGDKLTITLEENPTTGFVWTLKMGTENIVSLESDEYIPVQTSENVVGSGGNHVWIFKGISKGETVLTFKYYRPWEKEDTAIETRIFTVIVNENGEITSVVSGS